jgi:hypothetical protein
MERTKSTSSVLRQFRKKSRRVLNKDLYTEFFYLNRNRKVVEFLVDGENLLISDFFKEFLPIDFRDFVSVELHNDSEESINTWFFDVEDLVIVVKIDWGFRKEEISIDIDIDNFVVTSVDENGSAFQQVDYRLLNEFIISFLINQAKILSETYEKISKRRKRKLTSQE